MTLEPSTFDRLDHITNSLVEAGVIAKCVGQVYTFSTPGGAVRWSIDMIREALAKLSSSDLAQITHTMPIGEVRHYVSANPASIGHVDQSYSRCMGPEFLDRPLYVIRIPTDIGALPESHGARVVIDGNHRLVYAHQNGLPCRYYLLPPEIERACRVPIS